MASSIQLEKIATSYYAPENASAVNLYVFNGVYDMTLAQLVSAVCIRQAALIEQFSVYKMNDVNASASYISALSLVGEKILEKTQLSATVDLTETGYVPKRVKMKCTIKEFLIDEMQLEESQLPANLKSTDNKTKAFALLKNPISQATTTNQEQTIDLQSLLSRRDSTYNMSASVIKKLGTSMQITAGNF